MKVSRIFVTAILSLCIFVALVCSKSAFPETETFQEGEVGTKQISRRDCRDCVSKVIAACTHCFQQNQQAVPAPYVGSPSSQASPPLQFPNPPSTLPGPPSLRSSPEAMSPPISEEVAPVVSAAQRAQLPPLPAESSDILVPPPPASHSGIWDGSTPISLDPPPPLEGLTPQGRSSSPVPPPMPSIESSSDLVSVPVQRPPPPNSPPPQPRQPRQLPPEGPPIQARSNSPEAMRSNSAPVSPGSLEIQPAGAGNSAGAGPSGVAPLRPQIPPLNLGVTDPDHANCDHPTNGYEAKVGLCKNIKEHIVTRAATTLSRARNPLEPLGPMPLMVLDRTQKCKGKVCTKADKNTCCKESRSCQYFLGDIPNGCPDGKVGNPYQFAVCRTIPCSAADAIACCVSPHGELFERIDDHASKPARQDANDKAKYVVPQIVFAKGDVAWFDFQEKKTVGTDESVPLVNFMQWWGDGMGWTTTAWMKYSKNGA